MESIISRPNPDPNKTFTIPVRVYYEDTDAGGIVYHANFLKFAERARTEWLRATPYPHERVRAEHKLLLVVRHIEIDYRAPGKLDDMLEVRSSLDGIGNSSLTLKQDVWRGDTLLAALKVVIVAINEAGKPARLPPQLRQVLGA